MDLVAVHALLPACNDLRLDALRFAPFPPLWSAAARQQICLIPALQIAVVILAERLRAGSVMAVEIPNPLEQLRPAGLHRLIFRDQKPPLLQVIAFNRPVVAVVAHRIVLPWSDPISELVNMHSKAGWNGKAVAGKTYRQNTATWRPVPPEVATCVPLPWEKRAQGGRGP